MEAHGCRGERGGGQEFDAGFKLSSTAVGFVLVGFETLISMETKSCVCFSGYTMVDTLSGGCFFGGPSIILLGEL